jgi:uncharacterized protein
MVDIEDDGARAHLDGIHAKHREKLALFLSSAEGDVDSANRGEIVHRGGTPIHGTTDRTKLSAPSQLGAARIHAPAYSPPRLHPPSPASPDLPERELIAVAVAHVRERRMSPWGMHGLEHWWRVRHNGLLVAGSMGASRRVVTLFAIFHDSHRNDDGADRHHGPRAAAWLAGVRDGRDGCACATTLATLRALTDAEFNSLYTACDLHTGTRHHDDPTVAACFVADRLDLSRVGFRPDPRRMPAPAALVDDAFIEAAMERERKRLAWPGGAEIETVWGVRPA